MSTRKTIVVLLLVAALVVGLMGAVYVSTVTGRTRATLEAVMTGVVETMTASP